MSQADVELAQEVLAAIAERGYEALLPLVHPEFEMETLPGLAAEPQVYRGPEGMRRWWESFYEVMDEIRLTSRALHDAGDGLVAMELVLVARGQASGLVAEQDVHALATMRDGRLARFEFFGSLEETMAAAAERSG